MTAHAASRTTQIKICCITSIAEAQLAIAYGADAVGLVSQMPSGPGVIDDDLIAAIATAVGDSASTFLLTSLRDPQQIITQQRRCGTSTLQLVDALPAGAHAQLRAALPAVSIVQVVHVIDAASVKEAIEIAPHVDFLLLDSGNPSLGVKELGGTGRTHNWDLSSQIVASVGVPVFLAGGLNAANVGEAIRRVRPYGVDLCSGVRTQGRLDPVKLAQFVAAVATNPVEIEIGN